MDRQYIIPVVGQIYHSRNGGEYRCTGNSLYLNDAQEQRALDRKSTRLNSSHIH